MNKNADIATKIQSMKDEINRLQMLDKVVETVEDMLHVYMARNVVTPAWKETYEEDGEEKTKWHWTVYETDEDGNDIFLPPEEDDYRYDDYVALKKIIDQIKALA